MWLLTMIACVLGELQAGFHDELSPLYPDSGPGAVAMEYDAALGCPAAVHLIVDGVTTLELLDSNGHPRIDVVVSRLHDVPVEENTGLDSRTEQFKGIQNPHVIRRAPFRVFDAIEPLTLNDGVVSLPPGTRGLRLQWTPEQAGNHTILVRLSNDNATLTLPWLVETHNWRPPPRASLGFGYTNWFSPQQIAQKHQVELWSEGFWDQLARYARLMAHGGQDTFWFSWPNMFDATTLKLNEARLERFIQTFLDAGMDRIEGAPIASRPGGDWSQPRLQLRITNALATSEEGLEATETMASQLDQFMRTRGWRDRWVQHLADEPTEVNAGDYAMLAAHLHRLLPGVPIIEATMTRALVGSVDIWCPQVHKYQQNKAFFDERQAAGDAVWTYTCLVPGGPWINRLLDQERLRQVYVGWAGAHFGVQGFLHWGLNHYKADPWQQSVVDHPAMPNTTNKLPAGDTHLVYPGPEGPWSSTRLEAHRIGLEDLAMLKALPPPARAAMIEQLFRGYDDWERDVSTYRAVRRSLLEAVSSVR